MIFHASLTCKPKCLFMVCDCGCYRQRYKANHNPTAQYIFETFMTS